MDQAPLILVHSLDLRIAGVVAQLHAKIEARAEQAHLDIQERIRWAREHINRMAGQRVRRQREYEQKT